MAIDPQPRLGFEGVFNILATPFTLDYVLDEDSLRRLVDATVATGVDGITILGVAGEASKLTADERQRVTSIVLERVDSRLPVVVGTTHDGTDATIGASRLAESAGASGVMIAPPSGVQPSPALTDHYRRVASAIGIPIVLQDFPTVSGVSMSPQAMADLVSAVPQVTTIKLEGAPTPLRTGKTVALLSEGTTVVGGMGGMYFLDELRRGARGTMTGFAYSEVLVDIWRGWAGGDRKRAVETYQRYLPLLAFEAQTGVGLAIRKEILRRRGFISSAVVRQPGPILDADTETDLSEVMELLQVSETFDNVVT